MITPRQVGRESRSGPAPSNPTSRSQRRCAPRVNARLVTPDVAPGVATYHRADVGTIAAALAVPRPARPSAGVGVLAVAIRPRRDGRHRGPRTGDRHPRCLRRLPRRDRRGGDRRRDRAGHRDGARRVRRLRPPVHGAPAVTGDLGPRRAAQPRAGAHRRARCRAPGGARSSASGRSRATGVRGDRALLHQPVARDRRDDRLRRRSIVDLLARDASLDRVWVGLDSGGRDQVLADTGSGPLPSATIITTLVRMPGDEPARWVRAHDATSRPGGSDRPRADGEVLRIKIETDGTVFGSLWAIRTGRRRAARAGGDPAALSRRRPDGPRPAPRPTPPGGDQRRGRASW